MPAQVTNYQCPACTGPLHYAAGSGKLECEYCGSSFDPKEIEAQYSEKEQKAAEASRAAREKDEGSWDASGLSSDWGAEASGMQAYTCPSCGAELICDETTAATSCPYCGNPTVVPGQFDGALRPDYVIPFRYTREQAIEALKEHYKGKPLLPRVFSAQNHIENIRGIYVPFWMFDGQAEGTVTYHATRSARRRSGDYEITQTQHFDILRSGSLPFEKVPVGATEKLPSDHMDSIEPFDYSGLQPFTTAVLPGFLADKFDKTVDSCADRADERCRRTLADALRDSVKGYDTCVQESESISLKRGKAHYALLPVWVLDTKWNNQDFMFVMNGQTGRIAGDLPTSMGRFWGMFAAIAAPLAAVSSLIVWLMSR